ncbi:magnesium/cobalt transporter CorA [Paracrocinitomix mangrovi]|uniref:magnesium/cobalt transporter CorA n=1 Tax=Paracrocinitomix mangrovi TaxID=2862509 RepID=UPI001C8E0147|nr:magnesium/cobalt transporter CorA [Paracrocinitomix mangrovi]UKN00273.1 magnesium/cobalt transporter CorA [Paracrocinitomix mangrovi]
MARKRNSINKQQRHNLGQVPGALQKAVDDEGLGNVVLEVFKYNKEHQEEVYLESINELKAIEEDGLINWVNVIGVHDPEVLRKIGDIFNIDDLVLEDIMNKEHRPKIEEYHGYTFMIMKMLSVENNDVDSEQVSMILMNNLVISFQEKTGDVFEPIRERLRKGVGRVRSESAEYLSFVLIDIIIDNYFFVMEHLGDQLDSLEQQILDEPDETVIQQLQLFKQQLILVRKSVFPLREMLGSIVRSESEQVNKKYIKYYRDAYDHSIEVIDSIETFIDLSNSVRDLYMSTMSNKMNEIMKVLTIMASIFIPLTFIAGIYGMNFTNMPEIYDINYGYPLVWAIMIGVTIWMIIFFKRKGWL